jgi:signal transduction histidine kinase
VNPRSFRTQLIYLVMLVLIPSFALIFLGNVERQESEKTRLKEQAAFAAKLAAASQAYYVKEARQILATMTGFPHLVRLPGKAASEKGMTNLKLISPDFGDFGLISPDGTVFCHALGGDVPEQTIAPAFIQRTLKNPAFSMSEVHFYPVRKEFSLQFAYPVLDDGQKIGRLMYATVKLPLLSEALADIPLPEGAAVTVMDRAGNVVARHPEPAQWVGKNLASEPFAQKTLERQKGVFESGGPDGSEHLYAVTTVNDDLQRPMLFIQVSVPQKLLFAQADAEFGGSLIGMVVIAVVMLGFARWFSKRAFLQPVGAMLEATDRLTRGELSARTGISAGRSELQILARRFDAMAETLGNRQRDLEQANAEIRRNNEELDRRVQERTEELRTLNRELEAFSYSVSHDLRAPLRHMDGFAQLLGGEKALESSPTARRYLGIITKSAKHMGTLIDDLLSFSRMARQSMAVETVDSDQIVRGIANALQAEESGREIVWRIQPLPPARADGAMLRQAWLNLISNAVKYSRGQTPAIIEISSQEEENEIVFSVTDNGAGFDMQYVDKLFGVFQRLHREDEFEGTGIGLANVRRIIQRHGGRTWARGEVGRGATFYFSLPKNARSSVPAIAEPQVISADG